MSPDPYLGSDADYAYETAREDRDEAAQVLAEKKVAREAFLLGMNKGTDLEVEAKWWAVQYVMDAVRCHHRLIEVQELAGQVMRERGLL